MDTKLFQEIWCSGDTLEMEMYSSHVFNFMTVDSVTKDLIDEEILEEIRTIMSYEDVNIYFGKTLRDVKLVIKDEAGLREHELLLSFKALRKLVITSVNLPHCVLQNYEYKCISEVINGFRRNINELAGYFYELEQIDQVCTVMEPVNPSFKDDYRKILLDHRTWLHVEVTSEGLATNIHLIGQSEYWQDKLQSGLLVWDHDRDIVTNIMTIFDLSNFPQPSVCTQSRSEKVSELGAEVEACGICLCAELPDMPGVPQPLCQNPLCGVHFHRNCLYQWLVACAGSRPPAFGVATGACPTCLQPVTCSR